MLPPVATMPNTGLCDAHRARAKRAPLRRGSLTTATETCFFCARRTLYSKTSTWRIWVCGRRSGQPRQRLHLDHMASDGWMVSVLLWVKWTAECAFAVLWLRICCKKAWKGCGSAKNFSSYGERLAKLEKMINTPTVRQPCGEH